VGKTSHFLAVNVNRRYVQNRNYFASVLTHNDVMTSFGTVMLMCSAKFWLTWC